jgi:hypothetical protein
VVSKDFLSIEVSIAFILLVSLREMPMPEAPNDEMFIKYVCSSLLNFAVTGYKEE